MNKIFKKQNGLTMIELLTVMSIIIILTSVVFGNYKIGNNTQALDRAAQKLAQDFRRVNEMSVSGKAMDSTINAYGIYFDKTTTPNSKLYIVYKNNKNVSNYTYSSSDSDVIAETIDIERGVKICDILDRITTPASESSADTASVSFVPPEPVVYMDADYTNHETVIKLGIESDNCVSTAKFKYIKINHVGRVDVANQ